MAMFLSLVATFLTSLTLYVGHLKELMLGNIVGLLSTTAAQGRSLSQIEIFMLVVVGCNDNIDVS